MARHLAGGTRCGVCGLRAAVGAAPDRTDFGRFGSFEHAAAYMYRHVFMIRGFGRYSTDRCARSLPNNLRGTKRFGKFSGRRAAVIDGFRRGANGDRCPKFSPEGSSWPRRAFPRTARRIPINIVRIRAIAEFRRDLN